MAKPSGITKEDEAFAEHIYPMAAILDPAFALHWVDMYVQFKELSTAAAKEAKENLKKSLKDQLIAEIESMPAVVAHAEEVNQSDDEDSTVTTSTRGGLFASLKRFRHKSGNSNSSSASQLNAYLDMCADVETDNPLYFWQERKGRLPTLYKVAMKLLSVCATSAPVERVFSRGGIFMRPHRARLSAAMLSRLVFIKCNRDLFVAGSL